LIQIKKAYRDGKPSVALYIVEFTQYQHSLPLQERMMMVDVYIVSHNFRLQRKGKNEYAKIIFFIKSFIIKVKFKNAYILKLLMPIVINFSMFN